MEVATTSVKFLFNGAVYNQIDGIAMGSPLGPTLANIFVGYYEEHLFNQISRPPTYFRYVDDTFVVFDSKCDHSRFLQQLNLLHPALEFTTELEENNTLPFLDVSVEKDAINNKFLTSVYRKPTFTGSYVRYDTIRFIDRDENQGPLSRRSR